MAVSFTKVWFPSNNAEHRHQRWHLNLYRERRLFWALELFRVLVHWADWVYQLHISIFRSRKQTQKKTLDNSLFCPLLQRFLCLPVHCSAEESVRLRREFSQQQINFFLALLLVFMCACFPLGVFSNPTQLFSTWVTSYILMWQTHSLHTYSKAIHIT